MSWHKLLIQALVPYLVQLVKYIYQQITLKKYREKRKEIAKKKGTSYADSKTKEEVKEAYENLP